MNCKKLCILTNTRCPNKSCRYWLGYGADLNCALIAIDKKDGPMLLREIAKRVNLTLSRVQQIEMSSLEKIRKKLEIDNDLQSKR